MQNIYIFGAHSRAQTLAVYLKTIYPEISVEAFLYDNGEVNPAEVEGAPVNDLNSAVELHVGYPVYLGTRGVYHDAITAKLRGLGFGEIIPVTVDLDMQLRNAYLEKWFAGVGREFCKIDDYRADDCSTEYSGETDIGALPTTCVYVAKSVYDKQLQQEYLLADYEKVIQVGAELTAERLAHYSYLDNVGKNISERNKQFCELTALYWMWKNATEDIVGLVHYRRHFILPDDWLKLMEQSRVDVILPTPLYVGPSLEENYKFRHEADDWKFMMKCLQEQSPEMYGEAEEFFGGNLYSPCNMFIMRKGVLEELCNWMFPILFKVVEHSGQKADTYQNRYPGFLSERLMSFFFEYNREKYKMVYADKNFLS